jgi:hypothetical protein
MGETNMKKGFIFDMSMAFLMVFIVALVAVIFAYVASTLTTTGTPEIDQTMTNVYNGFKGFDSVAPLVVVGIGVAMIISALLVNAYPVMFIIFFIGNLVMIFVSMQFSNLWHGAFTGNSLSAVANDMSNYSAIFENFPMVSTAISIVVAIVVFAKGRD